MEILIIKLGYSETFVNDSAKVVSLGDVLRATPLVFVLLKAYKNAKISWLTSKEAAPLISGAKELSAVHIYPDLPQKAYDLVINLEKTKQIYELLAGLKAKKLLGFKDGSRLEVPKSGFYQEKICHMLGLKWQKEPYLLGYKPDIKPSFKVGLNYLVGSKWPTKSMSLARWELLAKRLEKLGLSISFQEGKENLYEYINWLSSCEYIISQDSLGMHIAMALGRSHVALFGSTGFDDMYFYGANRLVVAPSFCPIMPCFKPACENDKFCMDFIDIDEILKALKDLGCLVF